MSEPTRAAKLVVYVGESDRRAGRPLYEVLLHLLQRRGVAGASAVRGLAGYGGHGILHTTAILRLSEDLPIRIEAVDSREKIESVLPDVLDLVTEGLVEVEDVQVYKVSPPKTGAADQREEPLMRLQGRAKMLRIHFGENDKWEGEPLSRAVLNRAKMLDIAGATVYRAIEGYGAHRRRHKAGVFSSDAPISIVIIDEEAKIQKLLNALDSIVTEGCLVAISDVEVIKYGRHRDLDAAQSTDERRTPE
jgi:PII-like signaling protein